MSLGLFNCRLIQPAGDQLFFFAGCLASSGKLCSVSLCPILLGPDQREGAACFLFFLLRRVLFGFFKGGFAPFEKPKQNPSEKEKQKACCALPLVGAEQGGSRRRLNRACPNWQDNRRRRIADLQRVGLICS